VNFLNNSQGKQRNTRAEAFFIINEYTEKGNYLKDLINKHIAKPYFSDLDKRFIYEICKGTVKYLLKLDFLISLYSKLEIKKIEPQVLNILRISAYQLLFLSRVPAYSILDESVQIAKKYISLSSSKFVNAVLRSISKQDNLLNYASRKIEESIQDKIIKLSLMYSFPQWLIEYWHKEFGQDRTEKICACLNENPITFVRINSLKTNKILISNELSKIRDNFIKRDDKLFEDTLVLSSTQNLEDLSQFKDGFLNVQDFSSQIAVKYFLKPKKDERILDLCAAPGGKTTYMAELIGDCGEIVSIDISQKKIELLEENVSRAGLKSVSIVCADASKKDFLYNSGKTLNRSFINYFDKIFLDAPCSALGTISKNPDVKYNKNLESIHRLSRLSFSMLENCKKYLKNEGKIIFYTCTISNIENQAVVEKFMEVNKGKYKFEKNLVPAILKDFLNKNKISLNESVNNYFEIMPYYFQSEGAFITSIIKIA
jgi:16S rRNA (cytosine967-C5)-methyltransferase